MSPPFSFQPMPAFTSACRRSWAVRSSPRTRLMARIRSPWYCSAIRFWRRHYNSDPGVVGRNLQLVHKNYTIVGVMPERFTIGDADVYTPLKIGSDPNISFQARVRLRPGVTHAAADAELQPLFEQFARGYSHALPQEIPRACARVDRELPGPPGTRAGIIIRGRGCPA